MNLLALDLGTRTGWALLENDRLESGVDTFDVRRGESPGTRYMRFNRWLEEFTADRIHPYSRRRIELIAYEQSHNRGGAATEVAAGFTTRVQELCARYGIEHVAVHSARLKKWTTGRGNAKKPDMMEAVARRWRRVEDDNEADAVALLHYALAELAPAMPGQGGA
jgi:Holliday junction resolvasome RuvABC endonuclease subunit